MNVVIRSISVVALIVIFSTCAFANPVINGVSGAAVDNSSFVISGTELGTKVNGKPLLWAPFNNGFQPSSLGRKLSWDVNEDNNMVFVSNEGWNSSGVAKSSFVAGSWKTTLGRLGVDRPAWNENGLKWYVFKRVKKNIGPLASTENWKNFRTEFSPKNYNMLAGESNNQFTLEYGGSGTTWWGASFAYPANQWQMYEIIAKNQSKETIKDGSLQFLKNNSTLISTNAFTFKVDSSDTINRIYPIHEVAANVTTWPDGQNKRMMLDNTARAFADDVYVDDEWNRVFLGNDSKYSNCTQLEIQIPSSWSPNSITINMNHGAFKSGTVYLYVFDENNVVNQVGYPIVIGQPYSNGGGSNPTPQIDNVPSIAISSPTSSNTFTTSTSLVSFAGSASDDKGISSVTWSSTLGGSGTATNLSGNWTSWQIANMALSQGNNPITVTVTDTLNQKTSKTLTINYSPVAQVPPPPSPSGSKVWDAVSQNGDSAWKNSTVTYTVRLLVKGSVLAQGGNQVRLGFQGRSSGNYTIRKVSIAQRDLNGGVGDVVDATWSRVTFDSKTSATWGTDVVTVPAGQEKFSDPIPFPLMASQDYYVTFKIDSPSVYLNPPAGYQELYFQSADRTEDIDWASNGHAVTQDYHALGSILAEGTAPVRLTKPAGVRLTQAK